MKRAAIGTAFLAVAATGSPAPIGVWSFEAPDAGEVICHGGTSVGEGVGDRCLVFDGSACLETRFIDRALSAVELAALHTPVAATHILPSLPPALENTPEPARPFPLWTEAGAVPKAAEARVLEGVRFHVVKPYAFAVDGYRFLHGVALGWHGDRLYASFGHNRGGENTDTEEARGRFSDDGGRTWSETFTIDAGEPGLGVSHGVFLSHGGLLWAFHGAYRGIMQEVHTRAYTLNRADGTWQPRGTVIEGGFWPLQEPQRMVDGNWIMAGIRVGDGHPAAVAISHGEDLLRWDLVVIPKAPGAMWGESSVILTCRRGPRAVEQQRCRAGDHPG
ncbi:MAG: hypothetical protein JXR77_11505 [Lentisphaeria bacterium]|nr:hypothetical protein [Lentisphaeria bacterium]